MRAVSSGLIVLFLALWGHVTLPAANWRSCWGPEVVPAVKLYDQPSIRGRLKGALAARSGLCEPKGTVQQGVQSNLSSFFFCYRGAARCVLHEPRPAGGDTVQSQRSVTGLSRSTAADLPQQIYDSAI